MRPTFNEDYGELTDLIDRLLIYIISADTIDTLGVSLESFKA
jgi:hypothetical protein